MKKILLKHKKLLVRIGSILACLLLVGALVLPCFALDSNSSYRDVLIQAVADNGDSNPAFDAMLSVLTIQKPADELNYWLSSITNLVTGFVDLNSPGSTYDNAYWIETGFTLPSGGVGLYGGLAQNVCFAYWYEYEGAEYSATYQNCYLGLQLDMRSGTDGIYPGTLFVVNADDNSTVLASLISARYVTIGDLSGVSIRQLEITSLDTYVFGSTVINPDGQNLALCFATVGNFVSDNQYQYGLLSDDTVTPINVRSLLTGWVYGSNEGGGASQEELDVAYELGFDAGFEAGFADDLLGDTFSAPFNALSRFTLFQWEDPVGNVHVITLMGVIGAAIGISLFIWFLKLFAGG